MNELESMDNINIDDVYNRIVVLIENAKRDVAIKVNNEMTLLYWNIGKDITENVLNNQKAEYGKSVIKKLENGKWDGSLFHFEEKAAGRCIFSRKW